MKEKMIDEIMRNQDRTNDHIFKRTQLETMNIELLSIVHEASKHMVKK